MTDGTREADCCDAIINKTYAGCDMCDAGCDICDASMSQL